MITSLHNPRLKAIMDLGEPSGRRRQGRLLVEGFGELVAAFRHGAIINLIVYCPDLVKPTEQATIQSQIKKTIPWLTVSQAVMKKLSYRQHPDAWLAVADSPETDLLSLPARAARYAPNQTPLWLVAEAVEKPGNLGALLRSADAAGAQACLLGAGRTDFGNPNVVRAAKGAIFSLPLAADSLEQTLATLNRAGVQLLAANTNAGQTFWDCDLRRPIAIAVGEEKHGLSPGLLAAAAEQVQIPMAGRVNSLNLAQAATLILYEAARQRRQP